MMMALRRPIELKQWHSDPPFINCLPTMIPNMIDGFTHESGTEDDGTYVRIFRIRSVVETAGHYLVSTDDFQYRLFKDEERK